MNLSFVFILAFVDINFEVITSNAAMDQEDHINTINLEDLDYLDRLYDDLTLGSVLKSNWIFTLQPSTFSLVEGNNFLNNFLVSTETPFPIQVEDYCLTKLPPYVQTWPHTIPNCTSWYDKVLA